MPYRRGTEADPANKDVIPFGTFFVPLSFYFACLIEAQLNLTADIFCVSNERV